MKKSKFRPSRMLAAMVGVILAVVLGDAVRRMFVEVDPGSVVESRGHFLSDRTDRGPASIITESDEQGTNAPVNAADSNSIQRTMTAEDIYRGVLVPGTAEAPVLPGVNDNKVNLSVYSNECYSAIYGDMMLCKNAADSLNSLMEAYYNNTGLADFAVYGTNDTYIGEGSLCPKHFPDSAGGNTVDLAIIGYDVMLTYDGQDIEGWVGQNCGNYGFIVRYPLGKETVTGEEYCPWHIRFVGEPHARVMEEKGICLEEYVRFIQGYTVNAPFEYTYDGSTYQIYSVPSMGDVTYINIPEGCAYDISGDGSTGYIVTIRK